MPSYPAARAWSENSGSRWKMTFGGVIFPPTCSTFSVAGGVFVWEGVSWALAGIANEMPIAKLKARTVIRRILRESLAQAR
jgi:hypothetical protein